MKKMLLAFDGTAFPDGAFAFARRLNELEPLLLVGVFVPQMSLSSMWSYGAAAGAPDFIPLLEQEDADLLHENIRRFEDLCQENGMRCHVHKDYFDLALPELRRESRFADLMLVDSESFYQHLGNDDSPGYLQTLLRNAECPVLVVPDDSFFPRKNILAYDGSAASVFAIRQFAYLFPQLCANETLLVFLKEDAEADFPEAHNILEPAGAHFPLLEQFKLDVNPHKYFNQWVSENKEAVLVSGAYGRSFIAQLLHRSFVSEVIAAHKMPLFIAHP